MKSCIIALTMVFAFAAVPLALEAATATGTATGIGTKQTSQKYMKGKTSVQKQQVKPSDNSTAPEAR
jgi:hypothetical protein